MKAQIWKHQSSEKSKYHRIYSIGFVTDDGLPLEGAILVEISTKEEFIELFEAALKEGFKDIQGLTSTPKEKKK